MSSATITTATGVTAQVETPQGLQSMRARYMLGCDGGRSQVRKSMGVDFEGFTYDEELPFYWELTRLVYIDAFRSTDPPIERPAGAPRYLGKAFTNVPGEAGMSVVREPPPPYPRP